jgi:hypothetical protein
MKTPGCEPGGVRRGSADVGGSHFDELVRRDALDAVAVDAVAVLNKTSLVNQPDDDLAGEQQ